MHCRNEINGIIAANYENAMIHIRRDRGYIAIYSGKWCCNAVQSNKRKYSQKKISTNKRSTHSPTTLWPIGWRSTWSFFVLEWLLFFSLITFSRWEFFLKKQRQFPKWKPIITNCVWKLPIYANSWVMNFYLSLFSSLVFFLSNGNIDGNKHSSFTHYFTLHIFFGSVQSPFKDSHQLFTCTTT